MWVIGMIFTKILFFFFCINLPALVQIWNWYCVTFIGTRLSGLNNRNLFSHGSGDQKSKDQSVIRVGFSRALFPTIFPSLCLYKGSPLCTYLLKSSPYKGISHIKLGPTLLVSLLFTCSVVSDSLQPHGLQLARLLCPQVFPGKNTEEY